MFVTPFVSLCTLPYDFVWFTNMVWSIAVNKPADVIFFKWFIIFKQFTGWSTVFHEMPPLLRSSFRCFFKQTEKSQNIPKKKNFNEIKNTSIFKFVVQNLEKNIGHINNFWYHEMFYFSRCILLFDKYSFFHAKLKIGWNLISHFVIKSSWNQSFYATWNWWLISAKVAIRPRMSASFLLDPSEPVLECFDHLAQWTI